jgi:hypothetical protein
VSNHEEQTRLFFKKQAEAEGISLREWCKKNGIVYGSFFGRDDEDDIPGKVYLSELTPDATAAKPHGDDPQEDDD